MNFSGHSFIACTKGKRSCFTIFRRLKSEKTLKGKEYSPCSKALNHFDDFYGSVFLKRWPSVRLGLLSRQKQLAVINNFGDVTETEKFLQNEGAFEIRSFLNVLKKNLGKVRKNTEPKEESNLGEIVLKQRLLEQERALSEIFPEDKEFHSKDTYFQSKDDDTKEVSVTYDPENPKTSLRSDLTSADFDKSRLILPDSNVENNILHNFVPTTQLRGLEEFVPEADYYKYYQPKSGMTFNIEDEFEVDFPESLKVYTFDRGDMTEFSKPIRCTHGVYNYLKVDGGDLLTALALGAQKKDKVLDLCSQSGNVAFCIFQTLPQLLVCIESDMKNTGRLFKEYLYDYSPTWKDILVVASRKLINIDDSNIFDKVLVDVPCTEDRLSLFEEEDNLFHPKLIKKRLGLPQFQCSLLAKALKLVKPGGTVVYSTKTLSPVQNDGIINEALMTVWQETKAECTVRNLSPALAHASEFFNFADYLPMKYGTLIVPFIPSNFGPRYFCKIIKNEK